MTRTVIYQGWRYEEDKRRPIPERVIAVRGDLTLKAKTEAAVRKMIEALQEEESQNRAQAIREQFAGAMA